MIKRLILLSFLFLGLGNCDCENVNLAKTCNVEPVECWVPLDVENIEKNIITKDFPRIASRGECRLGYLTCDSNNDIMCANIQYPVIEVCDELDNDCDGGFDEGFDGDHDGWTICGGDCDDRSAKVNPGAEEICNGLDDNCDGFFLEGETEDNDNDGALACEDCDDNNRERAPPLFEICDGIDNDCDGQIDEYVVEAWDRCGPENNVGLPNTVGECTQESPVCVNGELYCPATFPAGEVCDGRDNDCDGTVDEELIRECQSACGQGIEYCKLGQWKDCSAPTPSEEVCDGIDNNCDGEVDENCACVEGAYDFCTETFSETGEFLNCGLGTKECLETGQWGPCIFFAETEEKCDNYDNDCDGVIDEITKVCGDSGDQLLGECSLGNSRCTEGVWGECQGAVDPQEEVCDDLDNDCDGEIDEELNIHEKVDMVFAIDGSYSMCQYITTLASAIGQYVTDFEEEDHRFSLVMFPGSYSSIEPQNNLPYIVITQLVDVNAFLAALNAVTCTYPAYEPSYDVVFDLTDPSDPAGINWRSDAYPYVILMTDEAAQTWSFIHENMVATNVANCQVGECGPGDKFEIYVFIKRSDYFNQWDSVVYWETDDRIISIEPPNETSYIEKLRGLFTNVCL